MTLAYAHGYYICTGSDTTTVAELAVSTNNSYSVGSSWGTQWANQVKETAGTVSGTVYHTQVSVVGGNDIETFSKGPGLIQPTIDWMNAYSAVPGRLPVYNYGSADGCDHTCSNGWTTSNYYFLSWGSPPAYSFPESYDVGQDDAWYNVRAAGGGFIGFSATLSQYEACLQLNNPCTGTDQGPDQAWTSFANVLGYSTQFSDDIGYENMAIR